MEETAAQSRVQSLPFWVEITEAEAEAESVLAGAPAAPGVPDQPAAPAAYAPGRPTAPAPHAPGPVGAPWGPPADPAPQAVPAQPQGGEPEREDTMSIFGRRNGGSGGGNPAGGGPGSGAGTGNTPRPGTQLRSVPLGPLRRNLAETVDALQQLFADVAARDATMELSEVELSFEVSASGGIQLIGTGKAGGKRGLTLTFKRA
ncbi:Pepco domain-containing protein [Streptomyces palmae]|uniref:Pepco domain-containing protein n=1 Tax=Streptomyces palmae TaxID=1701085 RepID=A0A4Z0H7G8_9ACTN|nr:hypothetical protein [Streptomyces palmae]TGB10220.1 hypothetical protein E4099_13005 [Streptomyces palmae]